MKDIFAKLIFVLLDSIIIVFAIYLAFHFRESISLLDKHNITLATYFKFYPIYIITIALFAYEGIYTYRYDFWHESRLVIKAILFATILVFAYLAMTKSIENYSRIVIGVAFVLMTFFIPLSKNIIKKILFKVGIWKKKTEIYGKDPFLTEEIYGNPYLGYSRPDNGESLSSVFVNSKGWDIHTLKQLLSSQVKQKDEVIFIPLIDEYDLTHSHIYELSNTRTNLIVYKNRLNSRYRRIVQWIFNYTLALILLLPLLVIILIFATLIKLESKGPIFFIHHRIGQNGKVIPTIKFRSMFHDAKIRLEKLLKEDTTIKTEWEQNYKLKSDPRVTKMGNFLRKTSLDELPQIFNVLIGQMYIIGPRPVIKEELDKYYKNDAEYYYMVKPGITGLWQVSGRSDTDYDFRVSTDKWYVLNWSLWLDITILIKTIKVVLKRDGAY